MQTRDQCRYRDFKVPGLQGFTDVTRYLSKSVNSFFISLREAVNRVSTKISQDCPTSELHSEPEL
jgi:hypothetical protein